MHDLEFRYTNWRGDVHEYVISPERTLTYDQHHEDDEKSWQIHGQVVTRDGDPRPEMEQNRRRSFKLSGITDLRQVRSGEMQ